MSLTSSLSVASRSLEVFSAGIQVAGNNISNSSTPGYVREQLQVSSAFPSKRGTLIFGNGVVANGIRQEVDKFLEKRLQTSNGELSGAKARESVYKELETTLQTFGDTSLSTQLGDFLNKIQDLVNQPESTASREIVVRQGQQFAAAVNDLRKRIDDVRTATGVKLDNLVSEANKLIDEVASLNPKITALESAGLLASDAGGLRNQRQAALDRLSQILPINTVEHSDGQVDVFLNSNEHLVLASSVQHLETVASTDRGTAIKDVRVAESKTPLTGTGGELNGVIAGRDQVLGGFLDKLDTYVGNVVFEFNKLHASGQGLVGYYQVTGTDAASSTTAALNAAGLAFTPGHGSFEVQLVNKSTGIATTTRIDVNLNGTGTQTTLASLQTQLNGVANLSASLTTDRRLSLTAGSGYEIKFGNDTSGALAALGINTFFKGTTSRDIAVNDPVANDSRLFASGQGAGPADGRNAAAMATFLDQPVAALGDVSVDRYFEAMVSSLAQSSSSESAITAGYQSYHDSLNSQRDQFSGVSLDEEVVNVMKYQRAYQISARYISTVDSLFTALLNI